MKEFVAIYFPVKEQKCNKSRIWKLKKTGKKNKTGTLIKYVVTEREKERANNGVKANKMK